MKGQLSMIASINAGLINNSYFTVMKLLLFIQKIIIREYLSAWITEKWWDNSGVG